MSKKTFTTMCCIVLAVLAAVFMTTGAWAACTPSELDAGTCVMLGNYTVKAVPENGKFPYNCSGNNCFKYMVSPALTPASTTDKKYVDLIVPACGAKNTISVISAGTPTYWNYSAAGAGSYYTKWVAGDYQDRVMSFQAPYGSSTSELWFASDTPQSGMTSISLKEGITQKYGKIIGPDCAIAPGYTIQTITENKKIADYDAVIERDQTTGCISSLKYFDPASGWITVPAEPINQNDHTLITCGSLDANQKCQECAALFHSTRCTTLTSGGRTYKIPTGCI